MTSSPVPKTRSDFRNDVTKIESQMLEAIKELKDWRRQNTRVEIIDLKNVQMFISTPNVCANSLRMK